MKEISVTGSGLSPMCRLCLSSDVTLLDIFRFSSKMKNSPAGVIMKCATIQITRGDEIPNFICQACYTQVEKTHQFLIQIEQSDRTLQRYLQLLYASDKPIKFECFVQPSEDNLILNTNNDIAKCESLELNDVVDMDFNWKETGPGKFNQENKNNEEMPLKSEIKVELVDDNLYLPTECAAGREGIMSNIDSKEFTYEESKIDTGETRVCEDIAVKWKENEEENYIVTNKLMDAISLKSEIDEENVDDNLLTLTDSVDENEISFEDTKINIGDASDNSCLRSANVTGNLSKCEEIHKNISINRKSHKIANKWKSYQCDICRKCFSNWDNLNIHKRTHTGQKPYQCDVCNKCFSQKSNLNTHKLIHSGEKSYQCDLCNKCFAHKGNLKIHKRTHTGDKPYQCDLCNKCFSQKAHLNAHKLIHTGETPYQCDLCNKCFNRSDNLNQHKRTHTYEKPYQCDLCNKCFSQKSQLNTHKHMHTGEKSYQCDLCNKCFAHKGNLNIHKRTHTGEKSYQCDHCNRYFPQLSSLNHHKQTHTGEKPYQCDLCNKCFAHKWNLNEHRRTHTGEKPYQCDLCNKCFAHKCNLNEHKRTHTGEKPYQCDLCNKCFVHKCNLNEHKRTHTGEKPYQCDLCDKCFSMKSHLNTHKLIHTGEKPYQCDRCNKYFSRSNNLNQHIRTHTCEKPS